MYGIAKRFSALVAIVLCSSGANAGLLFNFSFDAFERPFPPQTPGPITGQILGLVDNMAGQAASGVVITGVGSHTVPFDTPFDVIAAGFALDFNSFDVASGTITAWDFAANGIEGVFGLPNVILEFGLSGVFPPQFIVGLGDADFVDTFPTQTVALVDDIAFSRIPTPSTALLVGAGILLGFCARSTARPVSPAQQ